jgi:hypothetical protein
MPCEDITIEITDIGLPMLDVLVPFKLKAKTAKTTR